MAGLTIDLKQKRSIYLYDLHQKSVHAWMWNGTPEPGSKFMPVVNTGLLESITSTAEKIFPASPLQILGIDYYKANLDKQLPGFLCIAQFISYQSVQPGLDGSLLILAWYQDEMFPVLQGQNAIWASEVDWNKHANGIPPK